MLQLTIKLGVQVGFGHSISANVHVKVVKVGLIGITFSHHLVILAGDHYNNKVGGVTSDDLQSNTVLILMTVVKQHGHIQIQR